MFIDYARSEKAICPTGGRRDRAVCGGATGITGLLMG